MSGMRTYVALPPRVPSEAYLKSGAQAAVVLSVHKGQNRRGPSYASIARLGAVLNVPTCSVILKICPSCLSSHCSGVSGTFFTGDRLGAGTSCLSFFGGAVFEILSSFRVVAGRIVDGKFTV